MVKYTDTQTYQDMLAFRGGQVARLEAERNGLKAIAKRDRTAVQHRRFTSIPSQLKTGKKRHQALIDLDVPKWDLLHILMDAEDTLWTPDEQVTWHKSLASTEGRGETALRKRFGLTDELSTGACDLIKYVDDVRVLYEEVKNLQGRRSDGKFMLQEIQTGKHGRQVYCMWMM